MQGRCTRRAAAPAGSVAAGAAGAAGAAVGGGRQRAPRVQAAAAAAAAARAAAARRERAAARLAEVEDSPRVFRDKCRRLARAIRNAKHLVVYTGAGISTAADIPDYRGPHGVWTRLRRGESVPRVEVSGARPTLTHMALAALWARGLVRFVTSQNCDGLHVRSGLPRRALAELHGNMYCERCAACRRVVLRAFDTTERTARHAHATRRLCPACGAPLHDTIVHFGERGRAAWPLNWAGALRHAAAADVIVCLGSSLKVLRRYPRLWSMARPKALRPTLYIVNLQWTPKDAVATLKINARCDDVMAEVCRRLRVRVPRYSARRDPLPAHATPLLPPERHTARRPALSPPAAPPSPPSPPRARPPAPSPSASDSDDDRPLTHLARRAPPAAPAAPAAPAPLTAFQVRLAGGAATLLLRPEHAPAPCAPYAPAPVPCSPLAPTLAPPTYVPAPCAPSAYAPAPCAPLTFVSEPYAPSAYAPAPCAPLTCASPVPAPAPLSALRQYRRPAHARPAPPGPPAPPAPPAANGHALAGDHLPVKKELNGVHCESATVLKYETNCDVKREFNSTSNSVFKYELDSTKSERKGVLQDETGTVIKSDSNSVPKEEPDIVLKEESDVVVKGGLNGVSDRPANGAVRQGGRGGRARALRRLLRLARRPPPSASDSDVGDGAGGDSGDSGDSGSEGAAEREACACAARIMARAVLLCRARLYPGLHTILGPQPPAAPAPAAPPAPPPGGCAWCWRRAGARRCLWYEPWEAARARVWRRVGRRRYLCTCCGDCPPAPPAPPAPDPPHPPDPPHAPGWFGKGYRKARRRR